MFEELEITVGNLSNYVQGRTSEKTLELPASQEEMQHIFKNIGIGNTSDEVFLSNYMIPEDLSYLKAVIHEHTDPIGLIMIMHLIQTLNPDPEAMDLFLQDHQDLTVTEFGNLILQSEDILYKPYKFKNMENLEFMSPEEKYAYTINYKNGTYAKLEALGMAAYVDFEDFGRNAVMNGEITLGDYGFLDKAEKQPQLNLYSDEKLFKLVGLSADLAKTGKKLNLTPKM